MPRPAGGYYLQSGVRVPSVTTITGRYKDSGQLMYWAFEQGRAGKNSLYEESGKAADVGTLAHAMVEARIKGLKEVKTTTTDPELIAKARQAFSMYEDWARQTRLKIIETEVSLVSEEYKYGGTGDAIGEIDSKLCGVEWKTANGVYPEFLVQMAANGHLWEENHPELKLTGGYHLLRFGKDNPDFVHYHFLDLADAWELFTHYRRSYDLDSALKKRVG